MPALYITVFLSGEKYYAIMHDTSQVNLSPEETWIFSKTLDVVAGQLYKLRQMAKDEVRKLNILRAIHGLCRSEHWK